MEFTFYRMTIRRRLVLVGTTTRAFRRLVLYPGEATRP